MASRENPVHSSNVYTRSSSGETDAVDIIATGLNLVTEVGTISPPNHFSEGALEHLSKMSRLFKGRERLNRVSVFVDDEVFAGAPVATIQKDIPTRVEPILRSGYSEQGFLEGTLEVINVHGPPTFTIWEQISGASVRCAFPNDQDWKQRVLRLLEKPVLDSRQVELLWERRPPVCIPDRKCARCYSGPLFASSGIRKYP